MLSYDTFQSLPADKLRLQELVALRHIGTVALDDLKVQLESWEVRASRIVCCGRCEHGASQVIARPLLERSFAPVRAELLQERTSVRCTALSKDVCPLRAGVWWCRTRTLRACAKARVFSTAVPMRASA